MSLDTPKTHVEIAMENSLFTEQFIQESCVTLGLREIDAKIYRSSIKLAFSCGYLAGNNDAFELVEKLANRKFEVSK